MAAFSDIRLSAMMGLPADANTPVLTFFAALIAVSALVLVIASVNVASMLLARAIVRKREIAVRIALGASRRRLIRQMLTESIILFSAGGVCGLLVAFYGTRLLSRIPLPPDLPIVVDAAPDARVAVATLVVALVTGIVFGLAPAVQGSAHDVATSLRGDGSATGRPRARLRNALVVAQVAASLVLLTTSGLFVRALSRGHRVDPGYDIHNVVTSGFDVSLSGYDTARARAFYSSLRERVAALPGVTATGYAGLLPLSMNSTRLEITVPGALTADQRDAKVDVGTNFVDGGYFDVLRLRSLRAAPSSHRTTSARRQWQSSVGHLPIDSGPGADPLGRTFKFDLTTITIVGVTSDVKFARLDEPKQPFMYLPLAQHWRGDVNLVVRTNADPSLLIASIRADASAAAVRSGRPAPSSASSTGVPSASATARISAATSSAGGFETTTTSSTAGSASSRRSASRVESRGPRRTGRARPRRAPSVTPTPAWSSRASSCWQPVPDAATMPDRTGQHRVREAEARARRRPRCRSPGPSPAGPRSAAVRLSASSWSSGTLSLKTITSQPASRASIASTSALAPGTETRARVRVGRARAARRAVVRGGAASVGPAVGGGRRRAAPGRRPASAASSAGGVVEAERDDHVVGGGVGREREAHLRRAPRCSARSPSRPAPRARPSRPCTARLTCSSVTESA